MPSATVRRLYEDQIPSFMSVFDLENDAMDQQGPVTVIDPKVMMGIDPQKLPGDVQPELRPPTFSDPSHKHHDSTSTQATESAESSPTTTVSCTDSSDLSDPSPSSSPDSPVVNLMPLSTFSPAPFSGLSGMTNLSISESSPERPMTSPAPRRPKNMKGLSIQPPFSSLSSSLMSEPCSPSFIKPPIPAPKRKPSQLSLKTNSSDLITRTTLEMPSSPSVPTIQVPPILQRRALKHSTSSPHMLSGLRSATFGPAGGMTIPPVLERNESGLSSFLRPPRPPVHAPAVGTPIAEEESPIKSQIANRSTFDIEPYHDVENNEDQKSPGYPDGPVCIYPDNVFLYLEPTAEEASRFDLVINVAREVKNPFKTLPAASPEIKERPADDSPIPDTALTTTSFATAFEFMPDEANAETPTTPKAQSFREPEYIHMQWDHNTDIAPDLMNLCELIDKKAKDGKKVLIHCQQGASRSASLIIAYGMYQNPGLSVNDAYHAAQARSRWISPNMKLMYCLQDFHKEVSKRKLPSAGAKPWSGRSPTKHRTTLSADNIERGPKEPLTAPLPAEDASPKDLPIERSPIRARGNSTPNRGEPISPGPSSAPSSFSWTEREDEADPGKFGRFGPDAMLKPPQPDSGFASANSFSKPLPSPGLTPIFISQAPLSPGPAATFSEIPMSPGFAPPQPFFRPPPSPGFGAHRFGKQEQGFGFVPLNLSPPPKAPKAKPKPIINPIEIEKKNSVPERHVTTITRYAADDTALLSPRVEAMTTNPLRGPLPSFPGMQFMEVPPTPGEGLFSPRETMFPRDPFYPFGRPTQVADPRSPPTVGETPIVRSIDELI